MSGGPVVAVDVGDAGVAVSVDTADGGRPAGGEDGVLERLDPVDVGCADGPVDLAAVFAPADGSALVSGHEARRLAVTDPARYEPNPRRRVHEGELLLGTRLVGVSEALGVVLGAALDRVGPLTRGGRPRLLVLTHPSTWGGMRREVLRRAGSGLADALLLLPEPLAVAAHAAWMVPRGHTVTGPLGVLDVGAGCVTASVVAPAVGAAGAAGTDEPARVLAERSDDRPGFGAGDDADELLLAHLVAGLRADDPARARVLSILPATTLPDRRRRQVLVDDVRAAKERLSDAEQVSVPLPGRTTAAWCSRSELEEILAPSVRCAVGLLTEAMAEAGVEAHELAGVHLVGGGARLPLLGTVVHRDLGIPATVAPEPRLVVARGGLAAARLEGLRGGDTGRAAPARGPVRPPSGGQLGASAGPPTSVRRARVLEGEVDPVRRAVAVALPDWPRSRPTPPVRPADRGRPGPDPGSDPAPDDALTAPLRVSPAEDRPRQVDGRRRRVALLAAAAALLVAVVATLLVAGTGRSGGPADPASTAAASDPADADAAAPTVVAFGHRYLLPQGWEPAGVDPAARRSQIRPADAPQGPDLVAVQEDRLDGLDPGGARARIVERYTAARAGGDRVSDLDVAARIGGRDVVHYVQSPAPGTTVDWYVVFSGPLQLSVGCRADDAGRERVRAACADVVSDLRARS